MAIGALFAYPTPSSAKPNREKGATAYYSLFFCVCLRTVPRKRLLLLLCCCNPPSAPCLCSKRPSYSRQFSRLSIIFAYAFQEEVSATRSWFQGCSIRVAYCYPRKGHALQIIHATSNTKTVSMPGTTAVKVSPSYLHRMMTALPAHKSPVYIVSIPYYGNSPGQHEHLWVCLFFYT